MRAGADGERGHALPALHLRHDRQAEGHPPHHRRLPRSASATTHRYVFDIKDDDIYWCAADIGWVTGHSYIVYGPLANGTTGVMYEGTPDHPDLDRWWEIIERYKVTILYTAPTAIRAHMKRGPQYAAAARPLVAAAARDGRRADQPGGVDVVPRATSAASAARSSTPGGRPRPAMIMISPLPGMTTTKPGSATFPFPGVEADVVDNAGQLGAARRGRLPRPEEAVAGDAARHLRRPGALQVQTYWSRFPGMYFPGDGASATTTATSGCWAGSTT